MLGSKLDLVCSATDCTQDELHKNALARAAQL